MSTQSLLPRLEIFTDLPANGGTRLSVGGFLKPIFGSLVSSRSVDGNNDWLKFSLPGTSEAGPLIREGQVARIWRSDSDDEWWPIGNVVQRRDKGQRFDISGVPLLYRLGSTRVVPDIIPSSNGIPRLAYGIRSLTPREILQNYLIDNAPVAALLPWLTLGTITPDVAVDIDVDSSTPLAIARKILDACVGLGVLCELTLDGAGALHIVTEIGSSAARISLTIGRNLETLTRTIDPTQRATSIEVLAGPIGGAPTYLGQARWPISAKSTNVLTLVDPAGGAPPIAFNDECVGLYLLNESNGAYSLITDSSYDPVTKIATVTVASGASFAVGDYAEFRVDTDGTQPYYLDHPEFAAAPPTGIGVRFGTVDRKNQLVGIANLIPNAIQRVWTTPAALPDGYVATEISGRAWPGTLSQNTDPLYTKTGKSLFFSAVSGIINSPPVKWTPWFDHQRMSAMVALLMTGWGSPGSYLELRIGIKLADGSYKYWADYATREVGLFQPTDFRPDLWKGLARGVWVTAALAGLDITVPSNQIAPWTVTQDDIDALSVDALGLVVALAMSADRFTAPADPAVEGYLDGVSLTASDVPPSEITEYGGANRVWQAGNVALDLLGPPQESYAVDFYDLKRMNPGLSGDDVVLGGPALVNGRTLGIVNEEQRIVEDEVHHHVESERRIVLASRKRRLIDSLLRGGQGGGTSGIDGPGTTSSGSGMCCTSGSSGGSSGGGSTSSTGTYVPVVTITLDDDNVPTAHLSVPASVVRVKIAGIVGPYPTLSDIRATDFIDGPAPYSATFAAIDPLDTFRVSAVGYDQFGQESRVGFAEITLPENLFMSTAVLSSVFVSSLQAIGDVLHPYAGSGYVWPTANLACLVPFELPTPSTVVAVAWLNLSVVSGNVDVGIYDTSGNRLVSCGSTAQAGPNVLQSVAVTPTALAAGNYYMAMAVDNTTSQFTHFSNGGVAQLQTIGVQKATSSFPLPNPITFANPGTDVPQFMVSFQAVI